MKRLSRNGEGFTLVELLVVVVILGVIAAVITFRVSGIVDTGATNSCAIEVRQVNTALEAYRARHGEFPPAASSPAQSLAALVPDFLDAVPSERSASGPGTYDASAGRYTAAPTKCVVA